MGDEVQTTGVATTGDDANTDDTSVSTVLTGDAEAGTGDTSPTDDKGAATNSDDDGSSSSDNDAGTDDKGQGESAGEEGDESSPDAYADFTLPEGMQLDEALLNEATPVFKELGLNQEQAQKLIDLRVKHVQADSQAQIDTFNQTKAEWLSQSENDSEFGGDNFNENVKIAQSAVNAYGTPELKQLLDDYGLGNHPEVIRAWYRAGLSLKEDSPGKAGDATQTQTKDHAEQMYPSD